MKLKEIKSARVLEKCLFEVEISATRISIMTRPLKTAVPYMSNRGDFCLQPKDRVIVRGVLTANAEQ